MKSVLTADILISLYPYRVGSRASQVYENPQTFKFHGWPSVSMDSSPVNSTNHGQNFPFVVGGIHGFKAHRYGGPTTYLLKKKKIPSKSGPTQFKSVLIKEQNCIGLSASLNHLGEAGGQKVISH